MDSPSWWQQIKDVTEFTAGGTPKDYLDAEASNDGTFSSALNNAFGSVAAGPGDVLPSGNKVIVIGVIILAILLVVLLETGKLERL